MIFTWKCPKCKEDNESEFKNIRQCQCGKKVKFGDCYTSRTIHTELGLGYAECEDCYCKDLGSDSWKNT